MHIKSIKQFSEPFRSAVISPLEGNVLAPFEGGSYSASRVKADWNCQLQKSAFSLVSTFI